MLHVHDLVDYVSEEADLAGRHAAAYVLDGAKNTEAGPALRVVAKDGVRYTVPVTIRPGKMADKAPLRFRVDNVYRDKCITVRVGDRQVARLRRRILTPGEMETVLMRTEWLQSAAPGDAVTVALEEA